jgi:hypothetical protein
MLRTILLSLLLPVMLPAQAIIQYSVAAAAGTAAGAAMGKQVSDTLDKVLAVTDEAASPKGYTKKPDGPYQPSGPRKAMLEQANAAAAPAPRPQAAAPERRPSRRPAQTWTPIPDFPGMETSWNADRTEALPAPAPPSPAPTAENLQELEPGSGRKDVVARLGVPAARITMSGEGGGLVEIYYYQAKGETLGSVRFTDGSLSSVIVNQ